MMQMVLVEQPHSLSDSHFSQLNFTFLAQISKNLSSFSASLSDSTVVVGMKYLLGHQWPSNTAPSSKHGIASVITKTYWSNTNQSSDHSKNSNE